MRKHVDQYLPLSQVNTYLPDRLHLNIKFPEWLDPDSLGLNVQRLVGLQTIAGIHLVDIQGKFEKQTTKVTAGAPNKGRYDGRGRGTGVSTLTTQFHRSTVPAFHELAEGIKNGSYIHAFRWLNSLVINMNLSEMSQRIRHNKGDVRKPDDWAVSIDQAIRQSVRREGTRYLTQLSGFDLIMYASFVVIQLMSLPEKYILNSPTELEVYKKILVDFFVLQILVTSASVIAMRILNKKDINVRPTFFSFGPEIDRAIMLNILSRKPLIRPMQGLKEEEIYHLEAPVEEEKDE